MLVVNLSVFSKDGTLFDSENVVTGLPQASWGLPYECVGSLKWKGNESVSGGPERKIGLLVRRWLWMRLRSRFAS